MRTKMLIGSAVAALLAMQAAPGTALAAEDGKSEAGGAGAPKEARQDVAAERGSGSGGSDKLGLSPTEALGLSSARKLMGVEVVDASERELGEVHDVLFDDEGRARFAVVSVGGILGIGDKLVAIQLRDFEKMTRTRFVLDVGRQQIERRDGFAYGEVSARQVAPLGFGGGGDSDGTEAREAYLDEWTPKMEEMSDTAAEKAESAAETAEDTARSAWDTVSARWQDLKEASAEEWEDARQSFEAAYDAYVTQSDGDQADAEGENADRAAAETGEDGGGDDRSAAAATRGGGEGG